MNEKMREALEALDDLAMAALRCDSPDAVRRSEATVRAALTQQPESEPDPDRAEWLASMYPDDRMFEEISTMARESYQRHINNPRNQTVTRADSMESHIVWATKRWIEDRHPKPSPQVPEEWENMVDAALTFADDPGVALKRMETADTYIRQLAKIIRRLAAPSTADKSESPEFNHMIAETGPDGGE